MLVDALLADPLEMEPILADHDRQPSIGSPDLRAWHSQLLTIFPRRTDEVDDEGIGTQTGHDRRSIFTGEDMH
ncbi:hypothetical protein, partial [Sphingomonas aurantiaca]|uniref:hypothetical protein n=1 Tax=Sphingomonas aurantiaca TaxID=185949 RepID=UPI001F26355C